MNGPHCEAKYSVGDVPTLRLRGQCHIDTTVIFHNPRGAEATIKPAVISTSLCVFHNRLVLLIDHSYLLQFLELLI